MLFSLLFLSVFIFSGVLLAQLFLPTQKSKHRIWLGLVLGLVLFTCLPALFAVFIGFTLKAQVLAFFSASFIGVITLLRLRLRMAKGDALKQNTSIKTTFRRFNQGNIKTKLIMLLPILVLVAIFILGVYLFSTHILLSKEGGYWGGQSTIGDLAMHLGFISSIATQGKFPPDYSIFLGQGINYPFLCESSAASLVLLGSNLRQAYLITAIYAFALVIAGVYYFFEQWLKRKTRSILATVLFFFGSGFGFLHFIDLSATKPSTLQALLGGTTELSNLQILLDGYYKTPTNLPALGLRWVNPIVDMLIPQRATLMGWAILFPCLFLLLQWTFGKTDTPKHDLRKLAILGILAGSLPLMHTHSFLALGVISACYFVIDLKRKFTWQRLRHWLLYGTLALTLAMPQLILFTFKQVAESSMLRFHFNWANDTDNFIWFYIKNWGWLFILVIPAFLCLSKRDRRIAAGPLVLWALAEVVLFQPNPYDNNKLIFVSFAFVCGLVARFASSIYLRIKNRARLAVVVVSCFLVLTTFLSSGMTILRELRSEYLLFWCLVRTHV